MKLRQVDSIPNFFINEESGIFYVRKMVKGRTVDKSTGLKSRAQAYRRYLEIMNDFQNDKMGWLEKPSPTLPEWWANYRLAKKKSPRTWKREEDIMNLHVFPAFGRLRLNEITQSQVERFLNKLRKTKVNQKGKTPHDMAEGSVIRTQSLLHAVFEAAMDDELIVRNPMRKIPRGSYDTRKRVVTVDEQKRVLDQLSPMLGRWFMFMLGTGLRLDECRGIRPETDFNREARTVHVKGKGHNGEPKHRDVPLLDPILVEIIDDQIAENEGNTKHHRRNRKGTLWAQEQSFFRKELLKACKNAKPPVAHFSPHTLRHTFATRYLQSGGDIFILSKILGHQSVEVTQRVYAHLLVADHAKLSEHVKLGLVRPQGAKILRMVN